MKWFSMIFRIGNDVQQKGWYGSKTVWFNIISLIAALLALKGFDLSADDVAAIAAGVSAMGNIGLRFVTNTPIGAGTIPAVPVPPDHPTSIPPVPPERPFDTDGNLMG